jgi:Cu-Zn family superoxide dismutase
MSLIRKSAFVVAAMGLALGVAAYAADQHGHGAAAGHTGAPGAGAGADHAAAHAKAWSSVDRAIAVLSPTQGNNVRGTVEFYKVDEGVRIVAHVTGLNPNSEHGFHVHEFGDISSADGTSAGGHYNPGQMPHGKPTDEHRHAGDLGNLVANDQGVANYEYVDEHITIADLKNPIIGRSVVVHAKPDKFTQPVGDAGPRIAVGVIGVAKSEQK